MLVSVVPASDDVVHLLVITYNVVGGIRRYLRQVGRWNVIYQFIKNQSKPPTAKPDVYDPN